MCIPPYRTCVKTGNCLVDYFSFSRLAIKRNVTSVNRKVALVIILTRAGLDLDSAALKRMRITVPKLGLIPWFVECIVIAIMTHYLLGLPWIWAFLLGYAV
jgi:NhaP-type Na+/H+ or K+/H+ antiporter